MKRKKYLACCLAMSMMLVSASPMAVSAEAQEDMFYSEELGVEEAGASENEEVMGSDAVESLEDGFTSEDTADVDSFDSQVETYDGEGEKVDTNEGWKPLTTLLKENRILYRYDENEKTLFFKCTEPIAIPDYNYGNYTDWFVDLGADKIAQIEKIVIGEGITGIGENCFETKDAKSAYSSLKEVKLPDSVTTISFGAFFADASLTTINLNKVQSVGKAAFAESGIENVSFEASEVSIGTNAFIRCTSLQSVNANNINSIGECAFQECSSLQSVKTKQITTVEQSAFKDCTALKTFIYEGGLSDISKSMFYGTAIESFNFGNVKTIGRYAFRNSSLRTGCYLGTREEWSTLLQQTKTYIPDTAIIHCKGDAVAPKTATCEEDGIKVVGTCAVCGEEYSYNDEENKLPALGHEYADTYTEDKAATCTEAGSKSKHCTREGCDAKTDVQEIPALGHKWTEDYVTDKEATCTEAGSKSKHCTICGAKEDIQEIKALGHDYVSKVTKEATCTEKGTLTKTCSRCNDVVTEEINALGHDFAKTYTVDKKATCTEAGGQSKHCTRKGCDAKDDVQAIPATGHKFGEWKVTTEATVFAAEQQERICETCGAKETKTEGTALKATATVNATAVKLKVKQSTSGLKVTGLAKGDSVKTWKSTNTKIFTVKGNTNGTCKLTAKKAGTAKLQITLASGLKKTVTVKVQKAAVKTTKVTVANTKVTVKKGKKVTLKPVVTPFTSKQKVTYTTSNKKIATVSKNGVVTGKKKGTAKITVKSGSKSVKVTVKVK